ncbi:MAG: 1,4-alpha-glucan branching protein GlgB [Clostridia bacterium]|nr:1,4-alpha-glucan branching protein GlgB [Clostridia bacterium]
MNKKSTNDNMAAYLFHQGTNYTAYEYLGTHETEENGVFTLTSRVWAPNARAVAFASDATGWSTPVNMTKVTDGVWETTLSRSESFEGTRYKFAVTGRDFVTRLKSDPYATASETLEKTASVVHTPSYVWGDAEWLAKRAKRKENDEAAGHFFAAPMNIYEVHLGSWKTKDGKSTENGENYLTYREAADALAPYLCDMGYTHVELLPVMEHPFDGSWGYQVTGYYAPTGRFGSPDDFAYFVDKMHRNNIGVILDWVPAHFPKDASGLYEFDGEPLYEYQGEDRMEHRGWGTRCFDVGRNEVQSFLVSNALYWMRRYHADGLRVDAVASMLYLDFDRAPGEWVPNENGDNKNLEAIAFFRKLNTAVFAEFPDALMIAEESTSWPMITKPVDAGGLGFNFKWNMGWANDMFEYVGLDPVFRQYHHSKLTFPLMYAFSENYILPVSHDEVVHGKKSLVDKMYGEYDEKFAGMRAFLVNMMTLPGKKLTFMGTEFAQFREWDFASELEWFMLGYPRHIEMRRFVKRLNHLYLDSPELWEADDSWDGFRWIYPDSADYNMVAYERLSKDGSLAVIVNYSPVKRDGFVLEVPESGEYEVVLNSDLYEFGGTNSFDKKTIGTLERSDKKSVLEFNLPPMCGIIFRKRR